MLFVTQFILNVGIIKKEKKLYSTILRKLTLFHWGKNNIMSNTEPKRFNYKSGERPEVGDLVYKRVYKEWNSVRRKDLISYYGIVIAIKPSRSMLTESPLIKWTNSPSAKVQLPQSVRLLARASK